MQTNIIFESDPPQSQNLLKRVGYNDSVPSNSFNIEPWGTGQKDDRANEPNKDMIVHCAKKVYSSSFVEPSLCKSLQPVRYHTDREIENQKGFRKSTLKHQKKTPETNFLAGNMIKTVKQFLSNSSWIKNQNNCFSQSKRKESFRFHHNLDETDSGQQYLTLERNLLKEQQLSNRQLRSNKITKMHQFLNSRQSLTNNTIPENEITAVDNKGKYINTSPLMFKTCEQNNMGSYEANNGSHTSYKSHKLKQRKIYPGLAFNQPLKKCSKKIYITHKNSLRGSNIISLTKHLNPGFTSLLSLAINKSVFDNIQNPFVRILQKHSKLTENEISLEQQSHNHTKSLQFKPNSLVAIGTAKVNLISTNKSTKVTRKASGQMNKIALQESLANEEQMSHFVRHRKPSIHCLRRIKNEREQRKLEKQMKAKVNNKKIIDPKSSYTIMKYPL